MKNYVLSSFCAIFLILNLAMSNSILQWNCRSIKANFEKLTLLVNQQKPVAVCLKETFLKDSDKFHLKYHFCYLKKITDNDKASGSVAVIVNNSVPHNFVKLETTLQTFPSTRPLLCVPYICPLARQLIQRNLTTL